MKKIKFPPFFFSFRLDWREFSKTSRPSICDLRFEEILNKIKPEKILYERGATGIVISTSNFANNGNGDGNGLFVFRVVLRFCNGEFLSIRITGIIYIS